MRLLCIAAVLVALIVVGAYAQQSAPQGEEAQKVPALVVLEPAHAFKEEPSKSGKSSKRNSAPAPMVFGGQSAAPIVQETTGNPDFDRMVLESAARNGLDPNLIIAVMQQESGFNPRAVSPKGARGLMQLMPATARRFGVKNIFDPAQNIEGGARYLRFLLDMFNGDLELALAGYNAGENAVINYGYRVPPYRETRYYVKNVSSSYFRRAAPVISGPIAPQAIASGVRLSNNY
jgi:soluble lytic murein transglycosylase-like protein